MYNFNDLKSEIIEAFDEASQLIKQKAYKELDPKQKAAYFFVAQYIENAMYDNHQSFYVERLLTQEDGAIGLANEDRTEAMKRNKEFYEKEIAPVLAKKDKIKKKNE